MKDNFDNDDDDVESIGHIDNKKKKDELIINDDKNSSIDSIQEDNNSSLSQSLFNDDDDEEKKDIQIKIGSKIKCTNKKCFENSIISINPFFFEINSDCGRHIEKNNIFDFIKYSFKEDKETCSFCHKTYGDLKNNNYNLYKCSCGKNACENCKMDHLKENSKEHFTIDFKERDYKCLCNNQNKKFIQFCVSCNRHLCQLCLEKHIDHRTVKLYESKKLNKEKLIEKLESQKSIIKHFNTIIDEWLIIANKKINEYKKKLELYVQINENIIEEYNLSNYQSIKNAHYLNFDFDDIVLNIIRAEYDMKKQTEIIFKYLDEEMKNYISSNHKEKEIQNFKNQYSLKAQYKVNNICELKKKGFIVIDFSKNYDEEEIKMIKKTKDYNCEEEMKYLTTEREKILSMSELRNGNLLILQKTQFKILEIDDDGHSNIIQTKKADEPTNFIQMIELTNGYLISLSQILSYEMKDMILWKKNLINGEYEKSKSINKKEAIYLLEMDKNSFLVYFDNDQINSYNSFTFKETKFGAVTIDFPLYFKKMVKVADNDILFVYQDLFASLNVISKSYKTISNIYDDIYYAPNSKNSFLGTYTKKSDKINGIEFISYNSLNRKMINLYSQNNLHDKKINFVLGLSNDNIITCSENEIKIWKIITK